MHLYRRRGEKGQGKEPGSAVGEVDGQDVAGG